jgi:uncharacterized protein YjbI with pentapeptide repeats
MKVFIFNPLLIFFLFISPCNASSYEDNCQKEYSNSEITEDEIKDIFIYYKEKYNNKEYLTIDFSGKDLSYLNLSKIIGNDDFLPIIINLENTNLICVNLANLTFYNSHFKGVNFSRANLEKTKFLNSIFEENTSFQNAHLVNSEFIFTTFKKVNFGHANMAGSIINSSEQSDVISFSVSNLSKANLTGNFKNSIFASANLTDAQLFNVDLSNSTLQGTNFTNTQFIGKINLSNTRYEPISGPNIYRIEELVLTNIWFSENNQLGLVKLRSALKEADLRDLEREVTYYIEKLKTKYSGLFIKYARILFLEFTCEYGLSPLRPLTLIIFIWLICSLAYIVAIYGNGKSGIYREWSADRIESHKGTDEPQRLNKNNHFMNAFYFSLLSVFHFGWREITVGNWLARIQLNEYTLRATGWVKSLSGVQSLLSLALLILFILFYFGRPLG